jgi:hypothetical protein
MPASVQSVTWTDIANCTVAGTTLTKTGGATAWDAGAHSSQLIAGEGYAEFTLVSSLTPSKERIIGLTPFPTPGVDPDNTPYGVRMSGGGIRAYYGGIQSATLATAVQGDIIRLSVEIVSGYHRVKLYHNGVSLWTFALTVPFPFPLFLGAYLYTANATVETAEMYGVQTPVQFTDLSTTDTTSWLWLFGDGATSTDRNPTYTYDADGTYNVTLFATSSRGVSQITQSLTIAYGYPATWSAPTFQAQATAGADPQVMLRLSNDGGKTWISEVWRSAGKVGEYLRRVRWNRLGVARRRVFEVSVTDPVPWRLTGAYIESDASQEGKGA